MWGRKWVTRWIVKWIKRCVQSHISSVVGCSSRCILLATMVAIATLSLTLGYFLTSRSSRSEWVLVYLAPFINTKHVSGRPEPLSEGAVLLTALSKPQWRINSVSKKMRSVWGIEY